MPNKNEKTTPNEIANKAAEAQAAEVQAACTRPTAAEISHKAGEFEIDVTARRAAVPDVRLVSGDGKAFIVHSTAKRRPFGGRAFYRPFPKRFFGRAFDSAEGRAEIITAFRTVKNWSRNPFEGPEHAEHFDISVQRIFREDADRAYGSANFGPDFERKPSHVQGLFFDIQFKARAACNCFAPLGSFLSIAERCTRPYDHQDNSFATIYVDFIKNEITTFFSYGLKIEKGADGKWYRPCVSRSKSAEFFYKNRYRIGTLQAAVNKIERWRRIIYQAQSAELEKFRENQAAEIFKKNPNASFVVVDEISPNGRVI